MSGGKKVSTRGPSTAPPDIQCWDKSAETWDAMVDDPRNPHYHYYRTVDLLVVQLLRATGAQRALELGCGTARCTLYALNALPDNQALHVTGIDISPSMIRVAQRNVEAAGFANRVTLQVGDAAKLDFPTGYFDVVFSRGALLSYARRPSKVLRAVHRVLRVDGALGLDALPQPPIGKQYYVGRVDELLTPTRLPERIPDQLTYREIVPRGHYQVGRTYTVKAGSRLFQELVDRMRSLPPHLPGLPEAPKHLAEGEFVSEASTRQYGVQALRQAVAAAGFRAVEVYGAGYTLHLFKDEELRPFVNTHRDIFSRAEIVLHGDLNLNSAVMLFASGRKNGST